MNKIFILILPFVLLAKSPFESSQSQEFDVSAFNFKSNQLNEAASENVQVKCRWVCDKKIYKEQKIAEAIFFYKNSKDYKFK
ncbi:hypothetical protein KKG72_03895 [bacterium]|nr:hypothetical protein [bacterium]MBU1995291.1 hypothetical protein [bacterium]